MLQEDYSFEEFKGREADSREWKAVSAMERWACLEAGGEEQKYIDSRNCFGRIVYTDGKVSLHKDEGHFCASLGRGVKDMSKPKGRTEFFFLKI